MTDSWISAMSFSSFAAPFTAEGAPAGTDKRGDVEDLAMRWQSYSSRGAAAGMASLELLQQAGQTGSGPMLNRIVEIHGLAGSIGEQLSLAWAAEQDAQRFQSPDVERDPDHAQELEFAQRMAVRALCEMSTHFLLGAAHSLANLVLRIVLCSPAAAAVVNGVKDRRIKAAEGFQPNSELKAAWPTFGPQSKLWAETLPEAAASSSLEPLERLVDRLTQLQRDERFLALEERRGMDYHRHRPQSLDHTSPRSGIWSYDEASEIACTVVPGHSSDARRDEVTVHRVCVDALDCVAASMREIEPLLAPALAACHLAWLPDEAPF
ncbi:hypothetical protein [Streptomyces sp. NPDC002962]|uniref:hypothetical protein n=1 Tax=Streptomyces sp. NPDC002962 TaxID=3364674 RepID=UPI0036C17555